MSFDTDAQTPCALRIRLLCAGQVRLELAHVLTALRLPRFHPTWPFQTFRRRCLAFRSPMHTGQPSAS